jgi:hypothetical protein
MDGEKCAISSESFGRIFGRIFELSGSSRDFDARKGIDKQINPIGLKQ